ncbi:hypothetical protein [Cupriavidus sp. Agwp_2]|uniref:hypothetical protein n=1 Tax=Cupriavidus sp. Agwp_2 TaxID=2897324 RepID=UPI00345F3C5F
MEICAYAPNRTACAAIRLILFCKTLAARAAKPRFRNKFPNIKHESSSKQQDHGVAGNAPGARIRKATASDAMERRTMARILQKN